MPLLRSGLFLRFGSINMWSLRDHGRVPMRHTFRSASGPKEPRPKSAAEDPLYVSSGSLRRHFSGFAGDGQRAGHKTRCRSVVVTFEARLLPADGNLKLPGFNDPLAVIVDY